MMDHYTVWRGKNGSWCVGKKGRVKQRFYGVGAKHEATCRANELNGDDPQQWEFVMEDHPEYR